MYFYYLCRHSKKAIVKMKYSTIFIDLDDTLLDTVSNTIQTLTELYADYGFEKYFGSYDNFFTTFQTNNLNNWHRYERNLITKDELIRNRFIGIFKEIDEVNDDEALRINEDYIDRIVRKDKLIDGARELLDYLSPRYKISTISNGFTEMQYRKIDSAGLSSYFDKVILSDEVGVNKPHPDIFAYALRESGIRQEDAIMIGDNYFSDIAGAYNSGINQIWFNPANKPTDDITPTHIVKRLADIKDIL